MKAVGYDPRSDTLTLALRPELTVARVETYMRDLTVAFDEDGKAVWCKVRRPGELLAQEACEPPPPTVR